MLSHTADFLHIVQILLGSQLCFSSDTIAEIKKTRKKEKRSKKKGSDLS